MLSEMTAPTKTKKTWTRSVPRGYWPQSKPLGHSWIYDVAALPSIRAHKDRYITAYLLKNDKSCGKDMVLESTFGGWVNENPRLVRLEGGNEDELVSLKKALNSAKFLLLGLQPDWDGEGSPGYSKETFGRMSKFLLNHSKQLVAACGVKAPIPKILPGPNGSIDLLWKSDDYELLLNIPSDRQSPASFYGDDEGNLCIKGKLDPDKINQGIIQWLMSHQTP
jgi:hypothetical protein